MMKTIGPCIFVFLLWLLSGCGCNGKEVEDGDVDAVDIQEVDLEADMIDVSDLSEDPDLDGLDVEELPQPLLEVFQRPGFDFVLPGDEMAPEERIDGLSFRAAQDEFEPVSFIVRAGEDLNLTADVSDLTSEEANVFPRENLDLRVVKVWPQGGLGRLVSHPEGIDVPELLVYDDGQELHSNWEFPEDHIVEGHSGQGAVLDDQTFLTFPTTGMDPNRGTVSFWFAPNWNAPEENVTHFLFNLRNTPTDEINVFYHEDTSLLWLVLEGDALYRSDTTDIGWRAGEWHHIVLTWDTTGGPGSSVAALYVDSTQAAAVDAGNPLTTMPPEFALGSTRDGGSPANGIFDELRVYSYCATQAQVESGTIDESELVFQTDFESITEIQDAAAQMRSSRMRLPSLSQELSTFIPEGTVKQFWLTARVDADTAPGDYSGTIRLQAEGRAPFELPITLTLLPFNLEASGVFHMFYFSFTLTPGRSMSVDETLMTAYLQDLRSHGVDALTLRGSSAYLNREIEMALEEGFARVVLSLSPSTERVDLMNASGYDPYFYGVDECNNDERLITHIRLSHEIHDAGGLVATALLFQTAERLRDPSNDVYDLVDADTGQTFRDLGWTDEALDWPNYHITYLTLSDREENIGPTTRDRDQPLMDYIEGLRAGTITKNPVVESYYWQPWVQSPNMNRFMAGFFLALSGLDGCWPWGYIHIPNDINDIYDESDNPEGEYRDFMTTYPSADGPIPTTQWEAFREGVDDVRYLETLLVFLDDREAEMPARVAEIRSQLDAILDGYEQPWYDNIIPPAKFEADRDQMIEWILELL